MVTSVQMLLQAHLTIGIYCLEGGLNMAIAAVYAAAAHCNLKLGQEAPINSMLLKALEYAPDCWEVYSVYTKLYISRKKFFEVKAMLQRLLLTKRKPALRKEAAYELLRLSQQYKSEIILSVDELKNLFETYDTKNPYMLIEHGKLLYELKDLKGAKYCFPEGLRYCGAEENYIKGLCNRFLAQVYSSSHNPDQNKKKALDYFLNAIVLGDDESLFAAAFLLDGESVTEEEKSQAVKLYEQAIEVAGDIRAMHNLGLKLFSGEGIGKDVSKAEQLYLQAKSTWEKEEEIQDDLLPTVAAILLDIKEFQCVNW